MKDPDSKQARHRAQRAAVMRRYRLKRWGPPRVVKLDGLDRNERAAILAIIEARKSAARERAAPDNAAA